MSILLSIFLTPGPFELGSSPLRNPTSVIVHLPTLCGFISKLSNLARMFRNIKFDKWGSDYIVRVKIVWRWMRWSSDCFKPGPRAFSLPRHSNRSRMWLERGIMDAWIVQWVGLWKRRMPLQWRVSKSLGGLLDGGLTSRLCYMRGSVLRVYCYHNFKYIWRCGLSVQPWGNRSWRFRHRCMLAWWVYENNLVPYLLLSISEHI